MAKDVKEIEQEVLKLGPDEKAKLLKFLLQEIEREVTKEVEMDKKTPDWSNLGHM